MKSISPTFIAVFLLCAMGVWGCGQQRTGSIGAKISELEARYAKLEEDYRVLQSNHDQHRKKLTQIEAQRNALEEEKTELNYKLDKLAIERETLHKQVVQRTQERDTAQTHLAQFGKELQALAGRIESALNTNSQSSNAAITAAAHGTE
jgi:chromosome segregation ATPase